MAEVKDLENVEQEATAPAMEETAADSAAPAETRVNLKARWQAIPRKKRRRIIRLCILALLLVIAAVVLLKVLGGKSSDEGEVVTDIVQYGSITSTVQGSGLTKAKSSETITITTVGTVVDVLVAEGETVTAGTPLFTIDSPAAETAVQKARSNVEGYEKQLSQAQKDIAGLNLSAGYAGKLMETVTLNPGDSITKGQKVAVLSDDTRLRLEQYYSYAYAGDLQVGQTVNVSIPALMTSVPGTVEAVHMVSRITPEGSKLFSADIIVENEGALTADMVASATATVNGETVYPYEAGKLAYYRTGDLVSTVDGTVISSNLVDYLQVAPGQVLVRIDGEESESQLFTIQQNLDTAREELKTAEENLANCNAKAPIDGMVIGLTIQPGDEIAANTAVVTISDTSSVVITANVDERNISYIKPGMPVELSQWGTPAFGTVETVSLSSTVNNGVATYPITISADNSEGTLQVNSYIDYTLTASENDNCLVLPLQCVRTVTQEDGSTVNVVFVKGSRPDNAIETPTQCGDQVRCGRGDRGLHTDPVPAGVGLMPMAKNLVELRDVYKIYGEGRESEVRALDGVSLTIGKGEFVAVVGQSGSGKSTMMNVLGCLDIPTRGTYLLGGTDVRELTDKELSHIRNKQIGFIFQQYNLIQSLTVLENVELPLIYQGVNADDRRDMALEALARVGLANRIKHRPVEMSGGQQQRVAIARAIATKPPIIMADEPTGALDSHTGQEVLKFLQELNKEGSTVILITHDNGIAATARRVVRLADGRIIEDREQEVDWL